MRLRTVVFACLLVLLAFSSSAAADVSLSGKLEVRHVDYFRSDRSSTSYRLVTRRGHIAVLPTAVPRIASGSQVVVRGRRIGHRLISGQVRARATATVHAAGFSGPHKVAVLLFNFATDTRQPWTADYVRQRIFTDSDSASAFYREESYGAVYLTGKQRSDGDVFGWYTIAASPSSCDTDIWAAQARAAAAAAGVDLTGYDNVIFAFPQEASCGGWSGIGEMPGTQSWLNGDMSVRVVAHELGHNMGLHHASSYSCTSGGAPVAISNNCTASEYGDPNDVMGMNLRRAAGWHLDQLGYIGSGNIRTVSSSGTYTLASISSRSAGVQLLRIPRGPLAGGSNPEYYDLDVRSGGGVFDNYVSTDPVVTGVSIHVDPSPSIVTQSMLIDTTPGSAGGFSDAALQPGHTFTDGSVTITTDSVSGGSATVDVVLGTPPPDTTPPSTPQGVSAVPVAGGVALSWTPASDNYGVAGYRIERDGAQIAQTTAPSYLDRDVVPGTSYSYRVIAYDAAGNVAPSAPAAVTMPAPSSGGPNSGASGGDGTTAPTPPASSGRPRVGILAPLAGRPVRRKLTVRAIAGDSASVARMQLFVDGVLRASINRPRASWVLRHPRLGRHVITVRAYNAAGKFGAKSVTVRVVR